MPSGRKAEHAAVDALRALLNRHSHIIQDIDGRNDFGEDLFVTFTAEDRVTGDVIKIQVKGGRSWSRSKGYAVPVGDHGETWREGNVPVICVVHDPEVDTLYWANATAQLLKARRDGEMLKSITVSPNDILDDTTIDDFTTEARHYAARYHGNQAVRTQLGEMADVEFGPSDIVFHFVNEYGEDQIFWQRLGEGYATLLHLDLDWTPEYIGPEMLRMNMPMGLPGLQAPVIGDIILNMPEAMWLAACFGATEWARKPISGSEPPRARIEVQNNYIAKRVRHHLWIEPDSLPRSIEIVRTGTQIDPETSAEISMLESNPSVSREVKSGSWGKMSPEAQHLACLYLVEGVTVGAPHLPIAEQFKVRWRYKRPWGEYGFDARVGRPSIQLTAQREIVPACTLKAGDRIYWSSRAGNDRGRRVSAVWDSCEVPGAMCVLFDQLSLGDTFWPTEQFARRKSSAL